MDQYIGYIVPSVRVKYVVYKYVVYKLIKEGKALIFLLYVYLNVMALSLALDCL